MKSLYESILDDEQVIASQSMKRLKDVFDILSITMGNDSHTNVQPARYFKWNDIKNYCKKNGLKIEKRISVDGIDISEMPAIIYNVMYIGFEQNILVLLRGFLKARFTISLDESEVYSGGDRRYTTYKITKPTGDPEDTLEMTVWYKKKSRIK